MDIKKEIFATSGSAIKEELSVIPVCAEKKFNSIASLNPYRYDWTIRVLITKILPIKHFTEKQTYKEKTTLSVLLIDEEGTEIEGTFWNEAADHYKDAIEEGKIYYFRNVLVKQANKKYSRVSFHYTLNFGEKTVIELSENQDTSRFQTKIELTEFEHLKEKLQKGQPGTVNVLGVVREVKSCEGSKRKYDNSNVSRREILLVNERSRAVNLTLWGQFAETIGSELEARCQTKAPVLLGAYVKMTGYTGLSLSTLDCSKLVIDPSLPEAQHLKEWYELMGQHQEFRAVNEGFANFKINPDERKTLREVTGSANPSMEDPEVFRTVPCFLIALKENKPAYYLGNSENYKKVVKQDNGTYCDRDLKLYKSAEHRYAFRARVADHTRSVCVRFFDKEARQVFGMSADEMKKKEDETPDLHAAHFKRCLEQFMICRIKIEPQENPETGKVRYEHTVIHLEKIDFAAEAEKVMNKIGKYPESFSKIKTMD